MCTLCGAEIETILHLFWDCEVTKKFIESTSNLLRIIFEGSPDLSSKKEFLFGSHASEIYEKFNYYWLHVKYYIWICRCKDQELSLIGFKSWLLFQLKLDNGFNSDKLRFIVEMIEKLTI